MLSLCATDLKGRTTISVTEETIPKTDAPTGFASASRATILVVDDEKLLRDLAARALEDAGFNVLTAASGEECLRLHVVATAAIALTITDFSMTPGMNGEELFNALLALNPKAQVMLSSGSVPASALSRMMQKGLFGFLIKPYTPRRLVEEASRIRNNCIL